MQQRNDEKRKKLSETGLFSEDEIDLILGNKDFRYEDFDEDDEANYISASEAFKEWVEILKIL
ncbi:MAG: hypothetical protein J5781_04280 [Clostridia bacterium]|nr:hypothetical protein [Clostridia bacterium]